MKIITTHVFPPIPIRSYDWCAHLDGQEEDGPQGWGSTKQDAVDDLKDQIEEAATLEKELKEECEL